MFHKFVIGNDPTAVEVLSILELMVAVLEYIESPSFKNNFGKDKKIKKNLIKRCCVEPLHKRILNPKDKEVWLWSVTQVLGHKERKLLVARMEALLRTLLKEGLTTETLAEKLAESLSAG